MKYADISKKLKEAGFELVRKSKHDIYSNGDIQVTVPHHKEVSELTAKSILKGAGIL